MHAKGWISLYAAKHNICHNTNERCAVKYDLCTHIHRSLAGARIRRRENTYTTNRKLCAVQQIYLGHSVLYYIWVCTLYPHKKHLNKASKIGIKMFFICAQPIPIRFKVPRLCIRPRALGMHDALHCVNTDVMSALLNSTEQATQTFLCACVVSFRQNLQMFHYILPTICLALSTLYELIILMIVTHWSQMCGVKKHFFCFATCVLYTCVVSSQPALVYVCVSVHAWHVTKPWARSTP